ncbi:MAG: phosphoglycerate kinase [Candidatus Gracilibacteria bacterium]|nr:phosphoglycerate kinase [Candidatus Gracilibacteria bacterium]
MNKKTIKDIEVKGKTVLIRVDLNVPLDKQGKIEDDSRITAVLPTLFNLIGRGAKLVLVSHLGRPTDHNPELDLKPIAKTLAKRLDLKEIPVLELEDKNNKKTISKLKPGEIVMLQNIRYSMEERENSKSFSKKLASYADIYVNDAFGVSHRKHASVVGITEFLPSVAGLLLEEEIRFLDMFMRSPAKPVTVIIGGKKFMSKIAVIDRFLEKADAIMIGGGIANNFLKAWGGKIGKSIYEPEMLELTHKYIWKAMNSNTALMLPEDVVIADSLEGRKTKVVSIFDVPSNWYILDIGPKTIKKYADHIKKAGTVIWSGPVGLAENPKFAKGTHGLLEAISKSDANSVIGGGDTLGAVKKYPKLLNKVTHVSTGGGATLEFIEKGTLPGIEALEDK